MKIAGRSSQSQSQLNNKILAAEQSAAFFSHEECNLKHLMDLIALMTYYIYETTPEPPIIINIP
jgi:hypothetical protein